MGFFKDFKRDFAQAVNELMPDKDELANEFDDEDMVNTFDDNDNMDIAPEDLLEDLDDYSIDNKAALSNEKKEIEDEPEKPETDYEDEAEEEVESIFDNIPQAEIITEPTESPIEDVEDEVLAQTVMSELLNSEAVSDRELSEEPSDELVELDNLDEKDMLESMEQALGLDAEPDEADAIQAMQSAMLSEELMGVDLSKAVEEALGGINTKEAQDESKKYG